MAPGPCSGGVHEPGSALLQYHRAAAAAAGGAGACSQGCRPLAAGTSQAVQQQQASSSAGQRVKGHAEQQQQEQLQLALERELRAAGVAAAVLSWCLQPAAGTAGLATAQQQLSAALTSSITLPLLSFVTAARSRLRTSQRPATASEWSCYSGCCSGLVRLLKAHSGTHQLLADLLLSPAALKQASVGCDGLYCPAREAGQPQLAEDVSWLSLQLQDAARKLEAGQLAVSAQVQAQAAQQQQQEALPLQVVQQVAEQQGQVAASGKRSNASGAGAGSSGKVRQADVSALPCLALPCPPLPCSPLSYPALFCWSFQQAACSCLCLHRCMQNLGPYQYPTSPQPCH